jgi:hypothetical protein
VFDLYRPLGRLPFLAGLTFVNTAMLIAAATSLTFLPTGGGHLAVLVVMGALHTWWFILHARRFADSSRSAGLPLGVAAAMFAIFAGGYLLIAALWSVPEVQQEAFRTGGGIGARHAAVETNEALIAAGRALASALGVAQAVLLTGAAVILMGFAAFVAGVFSIVTLLMPARRMPVVKVLATREPRAIR